MSRSELATTNPLFIHRPALQRTHGRVTFHLLTLVAWAGYLYLWLPLATLALWWGAGRLGVHELSLYPEFVDFDLFLVVAKALLVALVLLIGWAEYNRHRFQGVDRRQPQPDQDPRATADAMGVGHALVDQLQASRRAIVVMDDNAVPVALREASTIGNPDAIGQEPSAQFASR